MAIKLHNLQSVTPNKRRKRVGRGNSSKHGTYSTRGLKGQKSRSGVSGLKYKGMKHIILSTPKLRGFKSIHAKAKVVTLGQLDKAYKEGEIITPKLLVAKKFIVNKYQKVKIISSGKLTKKVIVRGCGLSKSAKEKIESLGGKVE